MPESSYHGCRPASVIVILVSPCARLAVRAVAARLERMPSGRVSQHPGRARKYYVVSMIIEKKGYCTEFTLFLAAA